MPAAVAVPLITAAASGTASIVGAKMASNASKNAAKAQTDAVKQASTDNRASTEAALAYLNQGRSQPQGQSAAGGYLSRLMGVPALPQAPQTTQAPYARMFGAKSVGMGQTPAAAAGGGMVMLEAPTGERRAVLASQADGFIRRGARRVE